MLAKYSIDRKRIALLGFSAGCQMGWRMLAARPETFYFFGGVANGFKHGKPPVRAEALRRAARHVPHFYAAGQADAFAGPMFRETARKLRQYGFELRTAYPAGVGHDLPSSIKTPLLAFMDEVRARQKEGTARQSHTQTRQEGSLSARKPIVPFLWGAGTMLGGFVCLKLALRRRSSLRRRPRRTKM